MTPQVSRVFPTSLLQPRVGSISVDPTTELKSNRSFPNLQVIFSRQECTEFISITTRVLYITEYLVLVEYTEAVLPMVYALYSMIAFHLPNGAYNHSFVNLSRQELFANAGSVFAYSILELTSLILAIMVLKRTLRLSFMHQLGFVLETQATMIQSKLMLWFVYIMQVPLEHVGTDFTFKFNWAHAAAHGAMTP
ncbi:hypothetical protein PF010_g23815 [Phytophthora fragariae]|uniref:Uncharacterized protein n=1 Tax=Phytophthora fragariae TaxID=53985 RepID=A0A6G0K4D8_9STRA|nr:hypothetical protein PF010_g23815 [Phytophthora fragariae]KAE9186189.1 hypothetical protein PF004_g23158 [Phytophthora fragariae]